jgi:DNA-directed RNA polymerase subunit RPC12/RpoP
MDLISRQAAIDAVNNAFDRETLLTGFVRSIAVRAIRDMPTAQPKVIIGHWIQYDKRFPWRHHYKCSVCGNYLDFSGVNGGRGEANFCPNCGAKMSNQNKIKGERT